MTTIEKMTIDERYKYLRIMQKYYRQAQTRQEKQQLLDEMERVTGLHRKYLLQLLAGQLVRHPRPRERGRTYGPEVDAALTLLWEALDYICAERLTPVLPFTAEQLAKFGELQLGPRLKQQLATISISTVRRHLPPPPVTHATRPRKRLQNGLQAQIPIRRIPGTLASRATRN